VGGIASLSLRELREKRGLTQEAVALLGGIDKAQVSRLERGLSKPRATTVVALSRALGLSVSTMQAVLANRTPDGPSEPSQNGRADS
jgi:transcriptional regulator with XRE-family HTH domain